MPDVFLYAGEASAKDVRLRDPTVAGAGGPLNLSHTGIGGATTGGAATVTIALVAAVSGGALTAGAATAPIALVAAVSGGAVTGGAGVAAMALAVTPSGGALTDGAATATRALAVTPTGGAITGGVAAATIALAVTPTGGALADGIAPATIALTVTGAGGAVAGGAASVSETFGTPAPPPAEQAPSGGARHVAHHEPRRPSRHLLAPVGKGPNTRWPRFGGSALVAAFFVDRPSTPAPTAATPPAESPAALNLAHVGAIRFTPRGTATISSTKRPSTPPPPPAPRPAPTPEPDDEALLLLCAHASDW